MYVFYGLCLITTGVAELQPSSDTGLVFLSSLHCDDSDKSLLDDCSYDPLGVVSCDANYGLARVKCFG